MPDNSPSAESRQHDFSAQYKRLFETAECRTQVELADFFGIRQSSIADAKKRRSIPAEWLLKLLLLKGIHPVWIKTGQGPRMMGAAGDTGIQPQPPIYLTEIRPPEECTTDDLLDEITRRILARLG